MLFVISVFAMHEQQMLAGDFLCAPVYYILDTDDMVYTEGYSNGILDLVEEVNVGGIIMGALSWYCTNNIAEAAVTVTGISWCTNNRITNDSTESDSVMLIDSIDRKITSHWQIKSIIEKIEAWKDWQFCFAQCYTKASMIADAMVN
ncbi:hypothetical protein HAX54_038798 [Datura stramonium]|uniref:Uncharacterized protein n=1 Tax=Datura stramonium TaxID=4076 RepID=A0ABS8VNH9_DATST|nr:hypothetical protein [Datura stramonium]